MFIFGSQQQKNLEGYVGFANLPNQVYRKSVKRGFEFTLMVVGEYFSFKHLFLHHCFSSVCDTISDSCVVRKH